MRIVAHCHPIPYLPSKKHKSSAPTLSSLKTSVINIPVTTKDQRSHRDIECSARRKYKIEKLQQFHKVLTIKYDNARNQIENLLCKYLDNSDNNQLSESTHIEEMMSSEDNDVTKE